MRFRVVDNTDIESEEILIETELRQEIASLKEKYNQALEETEAINSKIEEYRNQIEKNEDASELIARELKQTTQLLGKTKVKGDGVIITMQDNQQEKIIESDLIRAEELSERLNNIEILHGDPLSSDVLETAGIRDADVVISATDDDKINILSSLLSKKWGAHRVATILNDFAYADILYSLGINSILDSRMATASRILHYIQERNIENILSIDERNIEVLSLNVTDNSYAVGVSIDEIITKNEIGILALHRNKQIFLLPKNMLLNVGDKILLVIRKQAMGRLLAFFQEKPAYLL